MTPVLLALAKKFSEGESGKARLEVAKRVVSMYGVIDMEVYGFEAEDAKRFEETVGKVLLLHGHMKLASEVHARRMSDFIAGH